MMCTVVVGLVMLTPSQPQRPSQTNARLIDASADLPSTLQEPQVLDALDLVAMTDGELDRFDPLLLNLIVGSGLPGQKRTIEEYVRVVDEWGERLRAALGAAELQAAESPLYVENPDLWRTGSMAVALAGPSIGITYTDADVDNGRPEQLFAWGLIDSKEGTCATMPVLYLAIAHRLGWPLKGVVGNDHMWCRWDDGMTRFNLEATSAESDGSTGSFVSVSDEDYARDLGLHELGKAYGADLASLSNRQLLGVFLQHRAGYWWAHKDWERAEEDLLLARSCFPESRDIFQFLVMAMGRRAELAFTLEERRVMAARLLPPARASTRLEQMPPNQVRQEMQRLNQRSRNNE
ncbi:MAG: hypothetical protein KDA20_05410 [Phycisphaerales bacterium]|nr:hypothetical protein [Phycisphaerales bacterium]